VPACAAIVRSHAVLAWNDTMSHMHRDTSSWIQRHWGYTMNGLFNIFPVEWLIQHGIKIPMALLWLPLGMSDQDNWWEWIKGKCAWLKAKVTGAEPPPEKDETEDPEDPTKPGEKKKKEETSPMSKWLDKIMPYLITMGIMTFWAVAMSCCWRNGFEYLKHPRKALSCCFGS